MNATHQSNNAWQPCWIAAVLGLCFGLLSPVLGQTKVDDQEKKLSERLLERKSSDRHLMQRIIDRMAEAETKLVKRYDAGPDTQALQRRVIEELDRVIASAVRRGSSRSSPQNAGDLRKRSDPRTKKEQGEEGETAEDGNGSETSRAKTARKTDPQRGGPRGSLRDFRRGWGNLPPRDREEVIQGASEEAVERFREWIERYYRALAEGDEE